jgi:site-specific DNA-methyltransferase (adenine-specific)
MKLELNKIYQGDALQVLKTFPAESIDCIMTSPPYWALRDYGQKGQLGLEPTFYAYLEALLSIFDEVKRVLKPEGTCWVNMGDTYSATRWSNNPRNSGRKNRTETPLMNKESGLRNKCLCQIPSRFAIEMVNRGWILRNEIIWHKPNCMPSSAEDRLTIDFEKIFFFTKNEKYSFETQYEKATYTDNRKDKGRIEYSNRLTKCGVKVSDKRIKRCVWKIETKPFKDVHFAVYPEQLCVVPIKSGCPEGGVVLDPFMGSGTTSVVARKLNRNYVGIELNEEYIKIAERRLKQKILL